MPIPVNSGSGGIAAVVNAPTARSQWSSAFLTALGVQDCHNNIVSIDGWQIAEGGTRGGANNPLNTKRGMPGDSVLPNGIHKYTSVQQGIDASVATIRQNGFGYPAIVAALQRCAPPAETMAAIAASQWGTTASDLQSGFDSAARTNGTDPVSGAIGSVAGGVANTVGSVTGGISSVADFLGKLTDIHVWIRVLYVVGGAALIALGITAAIRELNPVK